MNSDKPQTDLKNLPMRRILNQTYLTKPSVILDDLEPADFGPPPKAPKIRPMDYNPTENNNTKNLMTEPCLPRTYVNNWY